jgi:hypothetical protein
MILEAVWLKDDKEIAWVTPVLKLICEGNISGIEVFNGLCWYTSKDVDAENADGFMIRMRKEN